VPLVFGLCGSSFSSSARHVHSPRAGVDARAAALDFAYFEWCRLWPLGWQGRWPRRDAVLGPVCLCCRGLETAATTLESVILVLSVVSDCLGSRVVDSSGVRPWGWCVAFGALVLASVCGLGPGVDIRATALDLSALSVVPSGSGRSHIGSCSARPQGRCVAFGCTAIASFPYKLVVWVSGMSLNLPLCRFSASFPYKLVTSLLLIKKAELLPVAPKKKLLNRQSITVTINIM
jgi:hypothetical protein